MKRGENTGARRQWRQRCMLQCMGGGTSATLLTALPYIRTFQAGRVHIGPRDLVVLFAHSCALGSSCRLGYATPFSTCAEPRHSRESWQFSCCASHSLAAQQASQQSSKNRSGRYAAALWCTLRYSNTLCSTPAAFATARSSNPRKFDRNGRWLRWTWRPPCSGKISRPPAQLSRSWAFQRHPRLNGGPTYSSTAMPRRRRLKCTAAWQAAQSVAAKHTTCTSPHACSI